MTEPLLRKRLTTLELRVLRAAKAGNVWEARAPGHGTRIYSQAIQRLRRMGCMEVDTEVVTEEGDRRLADSEARR